jgi:hypothetical protein
MVAKYPKVLQRGKGFTISPLSSYCIMIKCKQWRSVARVVVVIREGRVK